MAWPQLASYSDHTRDWQQSGVGFLAVFAGWISAVSDIQYHGFEWRKGGGQDP